MARAPAGNLRRIVQDAAPALDELSDSDLHQCLTRLLLDTARESFDSWGVDSSLLDSLRLSRLAQASMAPSAVSAEELLRIEQQLRSYIALNATTSERPNDRFAAAHRLGQTLDLLMAASSKAVRKRAGSYFTPQAVATDLTRRGARALARALPRQSEPAVLDPACGGGAFLIEAARTLLPEDVESAPELRLAVVRCLHGVDLSELALAVAEASLTLLAGAEVPGIEERLVLGDALIAPSPFLNPQGVELSPAPLDWGSAFAERWPGGTGAAVGEGRCQKGPSPARGEAFGVQRELFPDEAEPFATHRTGRGFDWVVGNPPWVAFQGRATQRISAQLRRYYREHYAAFAGYATLHGMFVERAAQLAPEGVLSLLLPSSLADLDGYRAARRCVAEGHELQEPLAEYGQDAFAGVVQPCFGLVATPRSSTSAGPDAAAAGDTLERPWTLEERSHRSRAATKLQVPLALDRVSQLPPLRASTFGELGFQSNGAVVRELFFRGEQPQAPFAQPLLEGRRVQQFRCEEPRLFLHADAQELRQRGGRFRGPEVYRGVDFLVRQTAAFPIAAISSRLPFRNSLIAGYAAGLDPHLLVGLLNSALYRSLHLSRTRDARQAAFPQVKLSHLRGLPAPPDLPHLCAQIALLSRQISEGGEFFAHQRLELDDLVFALFQVGAADALEVRGFLEQRAPKALEPR